MPVFVRASRRAKSYTRRSSIQRIRRLRAIDDRIGDADFYHGKFGHFMLAKSIRKELERVKGVYTRKVERGWIGRRQRGLRVGPTKLGKIR